MSEIARSGLISVDEGQIEAATSLGMTRAQTLRLVILPQAMRVIIPPTGNEVISMLKTTSLAAAIARHRAAAVRPTTSTAANYKIMPAADRGQPVVPDRDDGAVGRPVLRRAVLLARARCARRRPRRSSVSAWTCAASGPRCARGPASRAVAPVSAMVEARGVTKSLRRVEVLKGVDLTVERGEVTCLIGPSGSGKSTLLRCINHLEKHDAGRAARRRPPGRLRDARRQALRAQRQADLRRARPDRHGLPALQPLPAPDRRSRT